MKKIILASFLSLIIGTHSFTSCKKKDSTKDPDPSPTPAPAKAAKFEITGNYTGQLFVVYNDNVSGNTTLTVSALPWSKTIEYPNSVTGIGIGGNSVAGNSALAGQTASLKIYNGSALVNSANATADVNGLINLPTITYLFQ